MKKLLEEMYNYFDDYEHTKNFIFEAVEKVMDAKVKLLYELMDKNAPWLYDTSLEKYLDDLEYELEKEINSDENNLEFKEDKYPYQSQKELAKTIYKLEYSKNNIYNKIKRLFYYADLVGNNDNYKLLEFIFTVIIYEPEKELEIFLEDEKIDFLLDVKNNDILCDMDDMNFINEDESKYFKGITISNCLKIIVKNLIEYDFCKIRLKVYKKDKACVEI